MPETKLRMLIRSMRRFRKSLDRLNLILKELKREQKLERQKS